MLKKQRRQTSTGSFRGTVVDRKGERFEELPTTITIHLLDCKHKSRVQFPYPTKKSKKSGGKGESLDRTLFIHRFNQGYASFIRGFYKDINIWS